MQMFSICGAVKSGKIDITKACENLGPRNLVQYMLNAIVCVDAEVS